MKKSSRARKARYQVFVSHATADKWIARVICEKLETAGAVTFRDDRDIQGGDSIPDRIRNEIAVSQEMVVLVTPESVARAWVLMEIGAAWFRGIHIVPVLCHVTLDPIPSMLRDRKMIWLNDFDAYCDEVRNRIGRAAT